MYDATTFHMNYIGDYPEYRGALDDLGFVWSAWRDKSFNEVRIPFSILTCIIVYYSYINIYKINIYHKLNNQ